MKEKKKKVIIGYHKKQIEKRESWVGWGGGLKDLMSSDLTVTSTPNYKPWPCVTFVRCMAPFTFAFMHGEDMVRIHPRRQNADKIRSCMLGNIIGFVQNLGASKSCDAYYETIIVGQKAQMTEAGTVHQYCLWYFYQFLALIELFSLILARLSSLTNRFSSSYGRVFIFFLLSSLNAGCLSSRCQSQSGYSESAKTLGSVPSLRILAPTTVVDLTSLLSVDAFGASPAAPPLEPFFLPPPTANVRLPPIPITPRGVAPVKVQFSAGAEAENKFRRVEYKKLNLVHNHAEQSTLDVT
ncbi:hypothetical protein RJ641_007075 [Dillenia turbinata]|uniref:Uncharacterized protein n=1 Tax=Dillenia turbinata TaxID=194707 RepID=A0AAN8Z6M5_9MAGN